MSDYQPGDIVDITIKGARVSRFDATDDLLTIGYGDHNFATTLDIRPTVAVVERVAPPKWPPRPGDLWRDGHGILWFASAVPPDDELRMHSASGGRWSIGHVGQLDDNAPWTLVHRQGAVS